MELHFAIGEGQQRTNLDGIGFTIPDNRDDFPSSVEFGNHCRRNMVAARLIAPDDENEGNSCNAQGNRIYLPGKASKTFSRKSLSQPAFSRLTWMLPLLCSALSNDTAMRRSIPKFSGP